MVMRDARGSPLVEIVDWQDRAWRVGDRCRMIPFGEGRIEAFVSASILRVMFDDPKVGLCAVRSADVDKL